MAKLTDKFFNRVIEGKFVAESGDELPKELPAVSAVDNGKALVVSGGKWQAGAVSGGSKLYSHQVRIFGESAGDGCDFNMTITSNLSVSFTKSTLIVPSNIVAIYDAYEADYITGKLLSVIFGQGTFHPQIEVVAYDGVSLMADEKSLDDLTITDTVTPL